MPAALRVLLLALTALALAPFAGPAAASCAAPADRPVLSEADSVFTGKVVGLSFGGGTAEVRVRDIWHGPDLPPEVVVVGGQLERGVSASTDRTYTRGQSYVFFVSRDERGILRDNACTPTARLGAYADLDPPGVRAPDPAAPAPTDPRGPPWARLIAGSTVLAAGLALLWRRQRNRSAGATVTGNGRSAAHG